MRAAATTVGRCSSSQCPKVTNTTIKAKQLMHLMGKQPDMRLIGDMAKAGSNGKEKKHAQISFREPRI